MSSLVSSASSQRKQCFSMKKWDFPSQISLSLHPQIPLIEIRISVHWVFDKSVWSSIFCSLCYKAAMGLILLLSCPGAIKTNILGRFCLKKAEPVFKKGSGSQLYSYFLLRKTTANAYIWIILNSLQNIYLFSPQTPSESLWGGQGCVII